MNIVVKLFFGAVFIFFIGIIFEPFLVHIILIKNTFAFMITQSGIFGKMTVSGIFLFLSAIIFFSTYRLFKNSIS